jgi:zinc D-Ala-D-Ala carboxypeptidase
MIDEIPEAIRDNIEVNKASSISLLAIGGVFCLGIGLLSVLLFIVFTKLPKKTIAQSTPQVTQTTTVKPKNTTTNAENKVENLLGHLPYKEASESELSAITADGMIRLRNPAATKFQQMQAAARAEGIILTAISGFRTTEDQDRLFFGVKEQRVQNATKRAEVSAPPGYSEHHTGYAVDIGDAAAPSTDLNPEFESTAAFAWLQKNAPRYSFELSFPRNNPQGISYEPWHWRFVGDRDSLETFYKVRNLNTAGKN